MTVRTLPKFGIVLAIAFSCYPAAAARPIEDESLAAAIERQASSSDVVAAFYRGRGYRPIWVNENGARPAAAELLRVISHSEADGLRPRRYAVSRILRLLRGADGDFRQLAQAELRLSHVLVKFARDLHAVPRAERFAFVDPGLAPPVPEPSVMLGRISDGVKPAALLRMHPFYEGLRAQWVAQRGQGAPREKLARIRTNMDRLRALPLDRGHRYVLVDAGSARLWMFEDDRPRGSMRVIVGKPGLQTPTMAGRISHVMFNPYWNVPPDLVRDRVAVKTINGGMDYVNHGNFQILSDWTPEAQELDPAKLDWHGIAAGDIETPRVRQRPGPDNMMGTVKFMLPNPLGIYLHDTPDKALFAQDDRRQSSGCVRLEHPALLSRWLLGRAPPRADPRRSEKRIDLAEPVPVYVVYLTALPGPAGLVLLPDAYGRDE